MSDRLKPCPFCGVIPTIKWEKWNEISEDSGAYVLEAFHTDKCYFVRMNGTNNKARKTAFNKECLIDAWNTRADRKTENSSEIPNNCEHITEDGVTCAKYPACDDCPGNPLNKVKGPERLVKGSDEPQQKSCATCKHALGNWDGESNNCGRCCGADRRFYEPKDEPQTESTGSPIGDYRDGVGAWQKERSE